MEKGKQRDLIESVKDSGEYTWKELGEILGFSSQYLRNEVRNGVRTLPSEAFEKLCDLSNKDYRKFIVEKLPSNWGQVKGGSLSSSPRAREPKDLASPSETLAEVIGLLLGDGNLYVNEKRSIYLVRVCGHSKLDRRYLLDYVVALFKKTFGMGLQHYEQGKNELIVYRQSKDIFHTLVSHGLSPGNKKRRNVGIPSWIMDNRKFMESCIRGLIDTDGSVYPKTENHPTPSIWFKSSIPCLRKGFRHALAELGFHPTKWTEAQSGFREQSDIRQCSLGRSEEVIRYYQNVGFGNPKHAERFLKFCNVDIEDGMAKKPYLSHSSKDG